MVFLCGEQGLNFKISFMTDVQYWLQIHASNSYTLGGTERLTMFHRCAWIFTEGLSKIAHTIYRQVVEKKVYICQYVSSVTFTQRYSIYHLYG